MLKGLMNTLKRRRILWARTKRLASASAPVFAASALTMIAAIIGAMGQAPCATPPSPPSPPHVWSAIPLGIYFLAGFGFIGLLFQAYLEYRRRTLDATLVLRYQDQFESKDFIELRKLAVDVLKSSKNLNSRSHGLQDIDPVLDFLEDLGFYEHGGQMSAEVIHHHFFYGNYVRLNTHHG